MPLLARRKPGTALVRRPIATSAAYGGIRSLLASANVVPLGDQNSARTWTRMRPSWQSEAWAYRRNLGELRYACGYLGNSSMRIRLFPGVYVTQDEDPVPVGDAASEGTIPSDLAQAAQDVLKRLSGGGPLAMSMMQKKITENFEVAGEGFLIGRTDPLTAMETWEFRSTSELITTRSGEFKIIDYPGALETEGTLLDPDSTFMARMWWPDPEWGALPDSPIRSVLDLCEELLLLGKDVRATARSRLALNGILGIPDELSIVGGGQSAPTDPNTDPFWQGLIDTVTAALTDEGSAASVVPMLLRGPSQALAAIKHIQIERPNHDKNIEERQELISRIATGIDLPSEVLTGKADLNHWTAWAVDDDTFRHHIEPVQVMQDDALTAGFLWPMLDAYGNWDPALVRKIVTWHDPTDLVTHPDRSQDAMQAWDRFAISDEALRKYLGFPDDDQPNANELLVRIVTKARTLNPDLVQTILKRIDPSLPSVPLPGGPVGVGGAPGTPAPAPAPNTPPNGGAEPSDTAPTGGQAATRQWIVEAMAQGIAQAAEDGVFDREVITVQGPAETAIGPQIGLPAEPAALPQPSAAARQETRPALSRKLLDVDRDLRIRLITAADASVKRSLERNGAKIISKSRGKGSEAVRASIAGVPPHRVPATVGPAIIAAMGLDVTAMSAAETFDDLKAHWDAWVREAQSAAARVAAKIAGVDESALLTDDMARQNRIDAAQGWDWLRSQLQTTVDAALHTPPPAPDPGEIPDNYPEFSEDETFVDVGTIRSAISIAGGQNSGGTPLDSEGRPIVAGSSTEGIGQIGTGSTIRNALVQAGSEATTYVWHHGESSRPFRPHEALDGVEFTSWDGGPLVNASGFPAYTSYAPGDHAGCSCDFFIVWSAGSGGG